MNKKTTNSNFRAVLLIAGISIGLFLCLDLLLGRLCPKIHTPTKYGWSIDAHTKVTTTVQDTEGNFRKVTNQYFTSGFKRWPKDPGDKRRVLIIGDSYTQMPYVSNGEEWYAYLERAFPDIAFYVFGAGGYGTLQEYLVMDDHFDTIKPDAIIWQFCFNDFSNNSYEFDFSDYPLNNHFARPYWENDTVVFRLPLPYPRLRRYSFSADRLLHVYDRKRRRDAKDNFKKMYAKIAVFWGAAKKNPESYTSEVEEWSQQMKTHKLLMDSSVEITKFLAQKVRARSGDIPIYFFEAAHKLHANDRAVSEAGGFICLYDLGDHMQKIAGKGISVTIVDDGHWNRAGNQYAGEKLVECFKNMGGIVPDQRRQGSGS